MRIKPFSVSYIFFTSIKYSLLSFVYPLKGSIFEMETTIPYGVGINNRLTEIVREYRSRLSGFIRKRVNSAEDAEDILQDVFYQLSEAEQLMKPVEQVSAWLFTVARNRITDLYRKKKPLTMDELLDEEGEGLAEEISNLLASVEDSPETTYLKAMIWDELELALSELPQEQREVFELNEMEGIPFKALSETLGIPVNTLISRKRYAVLHLRGRLALLYNELLNF